MGVKALLEATYPRESKVAEVTGYSSVLDITFEAPFLGRQVKDGKNPRGLVNEDVVIRKSSIHCYSKSAPSIPMLEQNLDAVKALVNGDLVEQKPSTHCHSRINSINANA